MVVQFQDTATKWHSNSKYGSNWKAFYLSTHACLDLNEEPEKDRASSHACRGQSISPGGQRVTYQVKLLLQLFISVIDAELFKAVYIEGLKTETQLNKLK